MLLIVVFWCFNAFFFFFAWAYFSLQPLFFRGRRRSYQRNESPLEKNYFTNNLEQTWDKKHLQCWWVWAFLSDLVSLKTFNLQKEKFAGGKLSKFRFTGPAAASTNEEKLSMFVIAKSEKPSCFKGIKMFPCRYWGQNKSWMNLEIF